MSRPRPEIPGRWRRRRRVVAFAAMLACGAAAGPLAQPAWPQARSVPPEPLALSAFTLEHQAASEALTLIYDLLSPRGTVELQPGGNTLVVRDTRAVLERVAPVVAAFDRPSRSLVLEIQIVQATAGAGEPSPPSRRLPEDLARRLRELLRYERFELVARAGLETREGQDVTYSVGEEFRVSFRMGRLSSDERLRLSGFRLVRGFDEPRSQELLQTNLNLWLDEPMVLGLARSEASDSALMVVLTCRLARLVEGDG